jgi:hypothetical protein
VSVSNSDLRRHRGLDEPMAMRLPAVMSQVGLSGFGCTMDLCGGIAFKGGVQTAVVIIILEQFEFSL